MWNFNNTVSSYVLSHASCCIRRNITDCETLSMIHFEFWIHCALLSGTQTVLLFSHEKLGWTSYNMEKGWALLHSLVSLSQSLLFSPPLFVPLSLSVCLRKRTSLLLNYYTMCLEHAGLKAVQCMKHKLMMISLTRIYTCRALCEVWVEVKFLILSLIQDKTLSVNPFHRICVCLSMPVSCTDVVLGYCYGRESREAASWRQELGQIWQILDYTVYGQPANKVCRKQATGCSACLCKGSLVQDQVEIYSQPLPSACQLYNPWLFLFKYKPETYSTASSP